MTTRSAARTAAESTTVSGAARTYICHCDGASRGNPGPAGAGVVVLDESGRERRAISRFLGETTNNVAEYLALKTALETAEDVCREDRVNPARVALVLKTDSELVARQVAGDYKVKSPGLAPLLGEFLEAARRFHRVEVVHVPREENARADRLAGRAVDDRGDDRGNERPTGDRGDGRPTGGGAGAGTARRYSLLDHLECSRCGQRYDAGTAHGACPSCGGPLLARYDLQAVAWPPEPGDAMWSAGGLRDPEHGSMWRYHELLPVTGPQYVVSLGEGLTPLIPLSAMERRLGLGRVFVKDESANPTGTFKARGASAAVSRLVELGLERCAVPTAGNAGSAFAAYCARAGLEFLAAMPEDTPRVIRTECEAYGAQVKTVPGLLTDAARFVRERAEAEGWFVASTFDEPYRVEGKKTIALEIFEAFGSRWPDAVVMPVGGGVALIAAWKAAEELAGARVGGKPPRLFAVQAAGCAPVVEAFAAGRDETQPFPAASTVAAGLRVPAPKAGFLILRALRATGGGAVAVSDEDILRTADDLRRSEGLNFCPEGAAAIAALVDIAGRGWLDGCREVVVVNTGTGLKYPPF